MRTIGNLFRSLLYLGIAGLVGYYNFETSGIIVLATNAVFFALGILLVATWRHGKSKSEKLLESQSLQETNMPVAIVERPVKIVKEDRSIPHSTETAKVSLTSIHTT